MDETNMEEIEDLMEEDNEQAVESVADGAPMNCVENAYEWLRGQKVIAGTLCRGRAQNRIRALAQAYPDEVQILADNADGSIFFHMPISYLPLPRRPVRRELTEEQKEISRQRFEAYRKRKKDTLEEN